MRSKSARSRVWKKLALVPCGALLALLLAEVGVRLLLPTPVRFPRHVVGSTWGLRVNEPGATYTHRSGDGEWSFRINQQGMRADRDYARSKPAGTTRVVALGDSFTIGYEVDVEQTFCRRLEQRLRAAHGAVEVLNAGVSGFSTAEEELYLERELIAYEPDAVLLCFFANDLVDNERADLFRLDGDRLVESHASYVPLGGFGDWLNRSSFVNLLSEHSCAFAILKEQVTGLLKRTTVEENEAQLDLARSPRPSASEPAAHAAAPCDPALDYRRRLEAAICERLYAFLAARHVPLVVASIPCQLAGPTSEPVDAFPIELFKVDRPQLVYVPLVDVLRPYVGKELLYRQRSHGHFTPFSHERTAEALEAALRRVGVPR